MKYTVLVVAAIALAPVAAHAQQRGGPLADSQATSPSGGAPIAERPFKDVPKEHWAYDAVEQMRKLGILRGYPPKPAAAKPAEKAKAAPAKRLRR
jgi:hypothetical protein